MEFSIDRLARLAQLQLSEKEKGELKKDVERIVAYVDQLREVDTEGVVEITPAAPEINRLREDYPPDPTISRAGSQRARNEKEVADLRNAFPVREEEYVRVPLIIKKT